jgi:hypothetical protein
LRRSLAAAVCELDSDRGVLTLHKSNQRLEAFGLRIVPQAEIVLVDQTDLFDSGRLDEDQPEAAECISSQVHEMEVAAGVARPAAIVHHRRYDEAVFQRQPA